MDFRTKILKLLYRHFPFCLDGDLFLPEVTSDIQISCIINFYGRIDLLEGILFSLSLQDLPREKFEVILVEDKGGTKQGKAIAEQFAPAMNIIYYPLQENFGIMGYSRNYGISKALGKYILLLDDDTVILDRNFLEKIINEFENSGADAIMPHGSASYCMTAGQYDFHAPFFPTSRCMGYRRNVLRTLKGFVSEIIGQEDVEFVVRYLASGRVFNSYADLHYFHPPLIINTLSKPAAVGKSFAKLRKRYPFVVWAFLLINGMRYLPLLLIPFNKKYQVLGKFSLGFLIGIVYLFIGKDTKYT